MNEFGLSTLQVLQLVGPLLLIGPLLVWMLLIGPLLAYPLARWKASRDGAADSQLGIKVALHYFKMIGFHVMLFGALILLWTIISKGEHRSEAYRAAFGFLVPGAIVYFAHMWFVTRTNDAVLPNVRRLFLGYNLIITGIVGCVFLVAATQLLFARGSSGDDGRLMFAGLFVYCGAWIALAMQFARMVLGEPGASAGGPPAYAAPSQPQAAQASGGGPSLPALGSAFPPIASPSSAGTRSTPAGSVEPIDQK